MKQILGLAFISLMLLPSAASAATVGGDVKVRGGLDLGVITFTGSKGEANRVTITTKEGRRVFRDDANRLTAKGDCKQVNRHTARCPFTEDPVRVKLGDKADRLQLEAELVHVFGGKGDDELHGSDSLDVMNGQGGNDEIHGGRGNDTLTGSTGRDQILGGSGDDELVDGETDAQSAPDVYRGGSSRDTKFGRDRGDVLDYSRRKQGLKIDLGKGTSNTRDEIRGLESLVGGSANDVLSGDGDDNWLDGEGGNDRVSGGAGWDIVNGGGGTDTVSGGDDSDLLRGNSGVDKLDAGAGDDELISKDSSAETVQCGAGEDLVVSGREDTLVDCETTTGNNRYVKVQPSISGKVATFQVACHSDLQDCAGTIQVASLGGEVYGSGSFSGLPRDPQTFSPVEVELSGQGVSALKKGETVLVTYGSTGGYRALIQGG